MSPTPAERLTPELVEQRLRELAQLHELGLALREVRFLPPERPDDGAPARRREPDVPSS
jgi:hypothetical protein